MNLDDLKFYAINSTGLGVMIANLNELMTFVVGIATLIYAVSRVVEQRKEHKHNELKRQQDVQIKQKLKEATTRD